LTYIKAHAQLKYHLPVVQDRRYPVRLLRCYGRPRRLRPERPASRREGFVGEGHPPSLLTQNTGLMLQADAKAKTSVRGRGYSVVYTNSIMCSCVRRVLT